MWVWVLGHRRKTINVGWPLIKPLPEVLAAEQYIALILPSGDAAHDTRFVTLKINGRTTGLANYNINAVASCVAVGLGSPPIND